MFNKIFVKISSQKYRLLFNKNIKPIKNNKDKIIFLIYRRTIITLPKVTLNYATALLFRIVLLKFNILITHIL